MAVFPLWTHLIFSCAFIGLVQAGAWDSASISAGFSSDDDPELPCIFKGEMYFHADSWIIDRDTQCHCNDSDVICDVMTCPYLDCDEPVAIPKEPCPLCFHNVMALSLHARLHPLRDVMTVHQPVTLTFDIDVLFEEFSQTTSVTGKRLWKLGAWGSSKEDGGGMGGVRHGYVDQILTGRQSSSSHKKDTDFSISDITFEIVPRSCDAVQYICLQFGRGDAPSTRSGLELMFTGPDEDRREVTACVRAPSCEEADPVLPKPYTGLVCRSGGNEYQPGEKWRKDVCNMCTCEDGQTRCVAEQCERLFCEDPFEPEGRCCGVCPYNVVGRTINFELRGDFDYSTGLLREVYLTVIVAFKETRRTTGVKGKGLWKLSAWASYNDDGSGYRMMYVDQLLNKDQSSMTYSKGKPFRITDVTYELGAYECEAVRYFCMTFQKGDTPFTKHGLDFQLRGLTEDVVTCVLAPECLPDNMLDSHWVNPDEVRTTSASRNLPPTPKSPGRDPNQVEEPTRSTSTGDNEGDNDGGRPDVWVPTFSEVEPRPPRPCVTRSAEHQHGDTWNTDPCTTCRCRDAGIRCIIKSCPPYFCFDPIFTEENCCPFCPPNVIVSAVTPVIQSSLRSLTQGQQVRLPFNVNVTFKETWDTTGVRGLDLWKLTAWTSRKPDGTRPGNRIEQALNDRQRVQKHVFGRPFVISGVSYQITVSNCQDVRYLCVKFDQSDNPLTKQGHSFYFGSFPDNSVLTTCTRLPNCRR